MIARKKTPPAHVNRLLYKASTPAKSAMVATNPPETMFMPAALLALALLPVEDAVVALLVSVTEAWTLLLLARQK